MNVPKIEQMTNLIRKEVPIKVLYKDESPLMKILNVLMRNLKPTFMAHFTTTIGYKVYFPSRAYVEQNEDLALRILAHEAVHLLDAKKWTPPLFSFLYLFPQIFVLGVFSFPWLGYLALLFLVFLFPIPSPTRCNFEVRGYLMNLLSHPRPDASYLNYMHYFREWTYYRMYPFPKAVEKKFEYWKEKIQKKDAPILESVILMYETVSEKTMRI